MNITNNILDLKLKSNFVFISERRNEKEIEIGQEVGVVQDQKPEI